MASIGRSLSKRFSTGKDSKATPLPPVATGGNGKTAVPATTGAGAATIASPTAIPEEKPETSQGVLDNFREAVKSGVPFTMESSTLAAVFDMLRHKDAIDDRKMLLEHGMVILSKMPQGGLATTMTNGVVKLFYNDLPHPPATYIGKDYQWRTADGSNNNIAVPEMGKANTPYARSVQQTHPLPRSALPDAGLIFDTLLRREKFVEHPAGLSSMMFAFAALVIHTVFQTSHTDVSINETSSYIDLAPLYGDIQADQDKIRPRDGRGLLYPDVFAEDRLMLLPPACCVLLVCFNRNHNFIAKKILELNERGTFIDPSTLSSADPKKNEQLLAQEEEIFQTARLCNIAWFGSIVFSDYFSAILGLVRQGSSWSLNPFGEIRNEDHTLFERGEGNVCSVEFNCLYRWHATTSVEDEKWVEAVFKNLFQGKEPDAMTIDDFKAVAVKLKASEPDIQHWTFGNMQRQESGYFKDQDLATFLHNATEHPAGQFGARHTPHIMRLHEIMGIESGRRWGVCSLNEFRKFLGLKTYSTFLEWNSNPEIADTAEKLYGNIDHLELYVGLQAEEAKPVVEGAGLCPGYTISRAILSDAIALTRGDRFFTQDYTPFNMTTWGFNDCQRDPEGAGFGSMLGRLLLRGLPEHYTENSVYTWFPLMTPKAMKIHLTHLGQIDKYDLSRPGVNAGYTTIKAHSEIAQVLADPVTFTSSYAKRAATVIEGKGFFLASDNAADDVSDHQKIISALAGSPESVEKIKTYFFNNTRDLIKAGSYSPVFGTLHNVNIVRDVLKLAPLRWAATEIAGIPLKSKGDSNGAYTESELFDILGDIYAYIFLEGDAAKQLKLGEKVKLEIQKLTAHIKAHLSGNPISNFFAGLFQKPAPEVHTELLSRLTELGLPDDHLANSILAIMVGSTVELSLSLTNTVELLLGSNEDAHVRSLFGDVKNDAQLEGFAYEALRIEPPFKGSFRVAAKDTTIGSKTLKAGDRVLLDVAAANLDESVFANPSAVDPARTKEKYLLGDGVFRTLGGPLASKIIISVLHAVLGLPNLRRGPGISGRIHRAPDGADPLIRYAYVDSRSLECPWPDNLTVQYDAVTPAPQAAAGPIKV